MKFKIWLENIEIQSIDQKIDKIIESMESFLSSEDTNKEKERLLAYKTKYNEILAQEYILKEDFKDLKEIIKNRDYGNFYLETALDQKIKQEEARLHNQGYEHSEAKNTDFFGSLTPDRQSKILNAPTSPFYDLLKILSYESLTKKITLMKNKKNINIVPDDFKEYFKKYVEIASLLLEIQSAVEEMIKPKIKKPAEIKAIKKEQEARKKQQQLEQRPTASKLAVQRLTSWITAMLQTLEDEYKETYKSYLDEVAQSFIGELRSRTAEPMSIEQGDKIWKAVRDSDVRDLIDYKSEDVYINHVQKQKISVELKDNYENLLQGLVNRQWEFIFNFFKSRMIQKIGPIVDAKAEETNSSNFEIEKISARASRGTVEGIFKVTFNDNSQFVVKHQAVYVRNINNTWFTRFPTTFSNVRLANGTTINSISEADLYRRFARIEKPVDLPDQES